MKKIAGMVSLSVWLVAGCGDDPAPVVDAGVVTRDAQALPDARPADTGPGPQDAAPEDQGTPLMDAGAEDLGVSPDASPDAGPDAGPPVSLLTEAEQTFFRAATPLPAAAPADTTNAYADDAAAATLGQKWFFDRRFSGPVGAAGQGTIMPAPSAPPAEVIAAVGPAGTAGLVACVSCHDLASGNFGDDRKTPNHISLGTGVHPRHAPPVVNSAFNTVTNWGGRFAAQWELPLPVSENPRIMNGSRIYLAQQIWRYYRAEYQAIFHEADHGPDGGDALMASVHLKIADFNAALPAPVAGDQLAGATIPRGKPKANAAAPDGLWEALTPAERTFVNRVGVNFGKALAAYQRKLIRRDAPFDAWAAAGFVGDAIPEAAQRGARVFVSAGCGGCHAGPMFSRFERHNLGLTQLNPAASPPTEGVGATPPNGSDSGSFPDGAALAAANSTTTPGISVDTRWSDDRVRGRQLLDALGVSSPMPESARGAFRTPSLRQVAATAPYMHAGQLATLAAVVEFYNRGGDSAGFVGTKSARMMPLGLTAAQQSDLVAFLEQLSGRETLPATLIMDTSGQ